MPQAANKNKHSFEQPEVNISRFRRAIDFTQDFTGGEKLIVGVIADHYNPQEGYAYPTERYLEVVYGFTPSMIHKTVAKLRNVWMFVDKPDGNNRYFPNMRKAESVLAGLDAARKEWRKRKGTSRGEVDTSRGEVGYLSERGGVPLVERPNVQWNAQPNVQRECYVHDRAGADRGADRDEEPVSTSDRMAQMERYTFLRSLYEARSRKHQPDLDDQEAMEIFRSIDGQIGFERILMGIDRVRYGSHTFAGYLDQWILGGCDIGIIDDETDHVQRS